MYEVDILGTADERSQTIGRRAATNAYAVLSGLLLGEVGIHIAMNGLTNLEAMIFDLTLVVLGLLVYFGTQLYYTRTM